MNGIQGITKIGCPRGVEGHQKASRIFIESPTGTGKSSFVLNKLFPLCSREQLQCFFISDKSVCAEPADEKYGSSKNWRVKKKSKDEVDFYLPGSILPPDRVINYQAISLNPMALETFLKTITRTSF